MENNEIVKKAVKYIEKKSTANPSIEDVAKNAGFSTDYFNRIFRNRTGFNVMEYIRFRKLNKAAQMLRMDTTKDILSIALDCGYESHEGFARAFKEQYGKTPTEYRAHMKNIPYRWTDHGLNETAAAEFINALPEFFEVDQNDAIAWLLENDAKRYGYTAIAIAVNGSKILCCDDFRKTGCLITTENFWDKPNFTFIINNTDDMLEYINKLSVFSAASIRMIFRSNITLEEVRSALKGVPYTTLRESPETMYLGEEFKTSYDTEKYTVKVLECTDLPAVDKFISQIDDGMFKKTNGYGLKNILQKPVERRADIEHVMGIFGRDGILAVAYTGMENIHGFCLNNCVHTVKLPTASDDEILILYKTATNEVIKKGYIPFEDSQFGEYAKTHGNFTAIDLGFERVNTVFTIDI